MLIERPEETQFDEDIVTHAANLLVALSQQVDGLLAASGHGEQWVVYVSTWPEPFNAAGAG